MMIEIKAFKCEFCKKIYISNRHKCKYNPEYKNCFTCSHNMEFFLETIFYDTYEGDRETKDVFVRCAKEHDDITARDAKNHREFECLDYLDSGGKWFENEYYKLKAKKEWNLIEF